MIVGFIYLYTRGLLGLGSIPSSAACQWLINASTPGVNQS